MKMTMDARDKNAIEKGMKKYNVDSKGFLKIVNGWAEEKKSDKGTPQYEQLLHLQKCADLYVQWGM